MLKRSLSVLAHIPPVLAAGSLEKRAESRLKFNVSKMPILSKSNLEGLDIDTQFCCRRGHSSPVVLLQ
jgi:hypothetical protein